MIDWSAPSYCSLDDVALAYWDVGPKDSPWPPIVFSHGFPELAFSWRHQMEALSAQGFRCVAVDQRGYGQSSAPKDKTNYTMAKLCGDLKALCDHLQITKVILCGHDWGGLIVWQMPLRYEDLCAGVISLNTPYTKRAPVEPIALYRKRFGEAFYIVWFQEENDPEAVLGADTTKTLTYFAQRPPVPGDTGPDTRQGSSLRDTILSFDATQARPLVMDQDAFTYYVEAFERSGFTGAVNWYRNFTENWHETEDQIDAVTCPSLMILADRDPVLPPEAANGMERYVLDLEKTLVEECGHWTQQEQPVATNQAISHWVQKRF